MKPIHLAVFGLWLVINLLICKTYRISRIRAGLYTGAFIYAVIGALIGGWFYRIVLEHVTGTSTFNLVAIFGGLVFTPVFVVLTVLVEKAIRGLINKGRTIKHLPLLPTVSVRDTLDMLTPGCLVVLAIFKFSCHFDKCCYGIPWSWGTYSPYLKTTVFPVQISEFLSILAVLAICIYLARRPFYRRGMAYPMAAAFYTFFRFGWEFLRYYQTEMRHLILGMTLWQFCCVIVFVSSLLSLFILYKTQPSEPRPKIRLFLAEKNKKNTNRKAQKENAKNKKWRQHSNTQKTGKITHHKKRKGKK